MNSNYSHHVSHARLFVAGKVLLLCAVLWMYMASSVASVLAGMQVYVASHQPKGPDSTWNVVAQSGDDKVVITAYDEFEPAQPIIEGSLQNTVDTWASSVGGTASVYIADFDGNVLAKRHETTSLPAASIYKTYVAYEGYKRIDAGQWNPHETYHEGWSRQRCLDEMIRTSHNKCGEKMLHEIGISNLQRILNGYGATDTYLLDVNTTSAKDAALVTQKVWRGDGLSEESHQLLLNSMREQIYTDGVASGFVGQDVYGKVGFKYDIYNDVSVVQLKDGTSIVVSVFTDRVGKEQIAALSARVSAALN